MYGGFGFEERIEEWREILDFALAYDLVVSNAYFKKRDFHLMTFKSGYNRSKIGYFLIRCGDKRWCKNGKVIQRESITFKHTLVVLDVFIRKGNHRIRWWS